MTTSELHDLVESEKARLEKMKVNHTVSSIRKS